MKEQEEKVLRPIGYLPWSLNKAEKNYTSTEKECLAILWTFLALRPYLNGQRFTLARVASIGTQLRRLYRMAPTVATAPVGF